MKTYYYIMSNVFFFLGDIVSKPMSWGWMDGESRVIECICTVNYRIYNWLMLKSVDYNDLCDGDVWGNSNEDDIDPEDDKFTPIIFTKDENNS